jgi:hypothetical protein
MTVFWKRPMFWMAVVTLIIGYGTAILIAFS